MTRDNQPINRDEWLASFADHVLAGKTDDVSMSGSDSEMNVLAETVMRLNAAFPKREPDSTSMKRIHSRVMEQWRIEEQRKARWSKFLRPEWLELLRRPQFAMAVAMIAVVVALVVTAPLMSTGQLSGTAQSDTTNIVSWILLGILLVAVFLFSRRKRK
jgi:hypothetical protein